MTEGEAKTKWCPFVSNITNRHQTGSLAENVEYTTSYNRPPGADKYNCIGSDCFMWEWREEGHYTDGTPHKKTDGDCGLKK